jgi:general secretion pathway protein K
LDVKSAYFKANIAVVLDGRKRQLSSWMWRKDRKIVVYYRDLVPFE